MVIDEWIEWWFSIYHWLNWTCVVVLLDWQTWFSEMVKLGCEEIEVYLGMDENFVGGYLNLVQLTLILYNFELIWFIWFMNGWKKIHIRLVEINLNLCLELWIM